MSSTPDRAKLRTMLQGPIKVLISYSHKDEKLREKLEDHLSILKHDGVIDAWHDRKIIAGAEWETDIFTHLDQAQIVLLLISPSFLASNYCYVKEGKRALARHEQGEAVVIPVILRPCDWKGAYFEKLQVLPKDARPIVKWPDRDEAFADVAKGIRRRIEEMRAPQPASDPGAAFAEAVEREQLAEMTAGYAAPEQIAGEPVDHSADIYALGVLAFEMITGEMPGAVRGGWFSNGQGHWEQALAAAEPTIPKMEWAALLRALANAAAGRPDSTKEILHALMEQ